MFHSIREFLSHYALSILAWLGVFLSPIAAIMWSVFALIFADFITGIVAAKRSCQRISSNRMGDTVIKMLLYQLAIIISYVFEQHIIPGVPLVRICAGYIGLTEVKSFFENINTVTGLNIWKYAKNYIRNKFKAQLDDFKEKDETTK